MSTKPKTKAKPERWTKAYVVYPNICNLAAGLALAARLHRDGMCDMIYFARYTAPPFRLEIQMRTTKSLAALHKMLMSYRWNGAKPLSVTFAPCNGSPAHACAFGVVLSLLGEDKLTMAALTDVIHWMYNMAGFSYAQEAAACALQSYSAVRGLPGWCETPIFSPKPVAKPNEQTKSRPHKRSCKK